MQRSRRQFETQCAATEGAKCSLATGEEKDLQVTGLAMECIEHPLDSVIVGKDEGTVEDHPRRCETVRRA
jgi:hypothetical protein